MSEIGPTEGTGEVVPAPQPPKTESTPDLQIGASTLTTPGPSTAGGQQSNDQPSAPDLSRSIVNETQSAPAESSNPTVNKSAGDGAKSSWKSTAFSMAKLLLLGVRDSADAFPPLKSVAGGLCFILENCERTKANKQSIESLVPRIHTLVDLLCRAVPDTEEQLRRDDLGRKLQAILQDLDLMVNQGNIEGFFCNIDNADRLSGLVEDIRNAMVDYQTSLQQDIYNKNCELIELADLALLKGMYHTPDAGYSYGNRQGCLGGTRHDVLREIEHWLTNKQDQRVFWLNGLAGTGKSTIAQTFAETSFADGNLGASFFCSQDFANRSSLQIIFPTLAFQLTYNHPPFCQRLLPVLRVTPHVEQESLSSQMKKLIVGPLKTASIQTLIIIDALDECKDDEPESAILSILSHYTDEIPNVKFFITGCPEPPIHSGFRLKPLFPITEVLKLHDVQRSSVDADTFFQYEMDHGMLPRATVREHIPHPGGPPLITLTTFDRFAL